MEECGKLQSVVEDAATSTTEVATCCNSRLLIIDRNTGLQFLVDSGADVSIIPYDQKKQVNNSNNEYCLYAANGTQIPTYGSRIMEIDLGLRRAF